MASLYKNVSSVLFSSTAIDTVGSIDISESGQSIDHSSDTDEYLTYIDVVKKVVEVTVNTDNLQDAIDTFSIGTKGTISFTVENAKSATPDLSVAISNAVLESMSGSPKHADVNSGGSLKFRAYSSDGSTSPLAIT